MAKLYKNEPEVFVADFEGNLVSVCYLTPDNHLGTMVPASMGSGSPTQMTFSRPRLLGSV